MINEPLLGRNRNRTDTINEEGGSINLKELTKAELMGYAAGQGIKLTMRMTKANMIAKIEAE